MKEQWKPIPGEWASDYYISTFGRVASIHRKRKWKLYLTPRLAGNGQVFVQLRSKDGKKVAQRLQRLAYEVFVGPIPEGMFLIHVADSKYDCTPENLKLVMKGEYRPRPYKRKPIVKRDQKGNTIEVYSCAKEAAEKNDYTLDTMYAYAQGRAKAIDGYVYRYECGLGR